MLPFKSDRPYFEAWLRRAGRQLAVSGCLTQTAMVLASQDGNSVATWRARLRLLLDGEEIPSLDLLTRIDAVLANPSKKQPVAEHQELLF